MPNRRRARPVLPMLALAIGLGLAASPGAAAFDPDDADVVSGNVVSPAEYATKWPYMVQLVSADGASQFDAHVCGGSLIDDQHVLTAAHCVAGQPSPAIRVIAKNRALSTTSRGTGEQAPRAVADIFVHPAFSSTERFIGVRWDVAVLRLAQPVAAASTVPLIQAGEGGLWGNGAGGVNSWVAGWGMLRDDSPQRPVALRTATIPLRSDALCSSTASGGYDDFDRFSSLCGGAIQTSSGLARDACYGDSGSPLIVAAGGGTWRQVGIVSYGIGCGEDQFGVYSRVDAARAWIDSIPGATDNGPAVGGPGGLRAVRDAAAQPDGFRHVRITWAAPTTGPTPDRYVVFRREVIFKSYLIEPHVATTARTYLRVRVPASNRAGRYTWNVRPVLADGSLGPSSIAIAGPERDRWQPGRPGAPIVTRRGERTLVVRWQRARDRQTGIDKYQVQRRMPGHTAWTTAATVPARLLTTRLTGFAPDRIVEVRVRALDGAGNVGNWSPVTRTRTRS